MAGRMPEEFAEEGAPLGDPISVEAGQSLQQQIDRDNIEFLRRYRRLVEATALTKQPLPPADHVDPRRN